MTKNRWVLNKIRLILLQLGFYYVPIVLMLFEIAIIWKYPVKIVLTFQQVQSIFNFFQNIKKIPCECALYWCIC